MAYGGGRGKRRRRARGVLRPGRVGDVLMRLWENLQAVPIRYSLAVGPLDILLENEEAEGLPAMSGADGSALHRASSLLEELRVTRSLFGVRLGEAPTAKGRMLSSLGEMSYLHLVSWTERQAEVFFTYRRHGVQREAARELGIDQSTVSHTLSNVEYRPMLAALDTFTERLDAATGASDR